MAESKKPIELFRELANNINSISEISVSVEIHEETPSTAVTHVNGSVKGIKAYMKDGELIPSGLGIVVSPDDMRWADHEGLEEEE